MNEFEILDRLHQLGVSSDITGVVSSTSYITNLEVDKNIIKQKYSEPHRYYHTWEHIEELFKIYDNPKRNVKDQKYLDILFLAIVFHDIIYDPKSSTNEEDSAKFFKDNFNGDSEIRDKVIQIILDTKTHKGSSTLSDIFQRWDLSILEISFNELIKFEEKIFKEYQFVDWSVYRPERIRVLSELDRIVDFFPRGGNIMQLIEYIESKKPNIGIYAGSFNPFHRGHLNILEKAEQIFDKVIIARGKNLSKSKNKLWALPEVLHHRQIDEYDGLLTDYINSKPYDVTLIRGLRNSTDLQAEITQHRYLQDIKPNIKVVLIPCDREFEHISSSGIREIETYGSGEESKYLL